MASFLLELLRGVQLVLPVYSRCRDNSAIQLGGGDAGHNGLGVELLHRPEMSNVST